MNWDEVGAIGQVLGSVAVFITLVYLAIQTRHAKDATQRAVSQARAEAFRHGLAWAAEPRMAAIATKANTALGIPPTPFMASLMKEAGLTREEALSQMYHEYTGWNNRLQGIAAVDGMSSIERHIFDSAVVALYGDNGPQRGMPRMFYDLVKASAPPEAIRYIDEVLARAVTTPGGVGAIICGRDLPLLIAIA